MIILFGRDTIRDHFTTPFYVWNLKMESWKSYIHQKITKVWMYEIIIAITRLYV